MQIKRGLDAIQLGWQPQIEQLLTERNNRYHYSLSRDWFLGFVEGEGTFLGIQGKTPFFQCTQHFSDYPLFSALREFVGGGSVHFAKRADDRCHVVYTLRGKKELQEKLLPLLKEPVIAGKFKSNVIPWLSSHWPDFRLCSSRMPSGEWLSGFTDGDGSFHHILRRQQDYKSKWQFQLVFDLAQKKGFSPEGVFPLLKEKWFPGAPLQLIRGHGPNQVDHLRLVRSDWLHQHICPIYSTYPLQSRKEIQYALWLQGLEIIRAGHHLGLKYLENLFRYRQICESWKDKPSRETVQAMQLGPTTAISSRSNR